MNRHFSAKKRASLCPIRAVVLLWRSGPGCMRIDGNVAAADYRLPVAKGGRGITWARVQLRGKA